MAMNKRPIQFRDYLPEVYPYDDGVQLTVKSVSGGTVSVAPFSSGNLGFRAGTPVTAPKSGSHTVLAQAIPPNTTQLNQIQVSDIAFAASLKAGDTLNIFNFLRGFLQAFETLFEQLESEIEGATNLASGGIADLFSPDTTPPLQFARAGSGATDFLSYLASWLALPLRPEKSTDWNRKFFDAAIPLYSQRSTLPGLDGMLRAWLQGELLETHPALMDVTDLRPAHTDAASVFQLGVTATMGVDTVLGEGPPFLFIADLLADPQVSALRTPAGLDVMQRAARFMIDAEKPAHTYYQLRLRGSTMQLAPPNATTIDGLPAAQIGATTLLWRDPWIYDSD